MVHQQQPAAKPNAQADVVMRASPPSAITVSVAELAKGYEKGFDLHLRKLGIRWREHLKKVPHALHEYYSKESAKIQAVRFTD